MVAQLVHVWVVLRHNGDGVTLLANDETSLLLCSIPQVDTIILSEERQGYLRTKRYCMDTVCAQSIVHGCKANPLISST